MIVTKGSEGCTYNGRTFPGIKVPVFDVAGAGDTFLAALVHFYLLLGTIDRAILTQTKQQQLPSHTSALMFYLKMM